MAAAQHGSSTKHGTNIIGESLSLTVVQHAPADLVTVWNSEINVCQLDILELLS